MRMTRSDVDLDYEWKVIQKFQKWLYNLHMNPIATRRNVKSDFRNVIVRAKTTVSTEYQKIHIRDTLNIQRLRLVELPEHTKTLSVFQHTNNQ